VARLPRLVIPGHAHYVIQRGHNGQRVFADEADRRSFLACLREAVRDNALALHAYALNDADVHLLVTPPDEAALSRAIQQVGRRYVSAYNRRHARRGTLWDGRFRCGVVEPGPHRLAALLLVDGQPGQTSAAHRTGGAREAALGDPAEFWQLGNTPFEREASYRTLLVQGVAPELADTVGRAAAGGWVAGSARFVHALAGGLPARHLLPRPAGRKRSAAR
jgi:putative transposase